MRKTAWVLILVGLLCSGFALAGDPDLLADIELVRDATEADRKALVAELMELSDEEAAVFWPLYREYRGEMAKVGDRVVGMITRYSKVFDNLSDADAAELLKEWTDVTRQEHKVREKHVKLFQKQLPASTVFRFFQIDNKLTLLVRLSVSSEIPLAR